MLGRPSDDCEECDFLPGLLAKGKRRMDLVMLRLLLEFGFCFITGGLRTTDQ
jgi:hypothetical protein